MNEKNMCQEGQTALRFVPSAESVFGHNLTEGIITPITDM